MVIVGSSIRFVNIEIFGLLMVSKVAMVFKGASVRLRFSSFSIFTDYFRFIIVELFIFYL